MRAALVFAAAAALALQGCVPFAVWVSAHRVEVAGIAAIGGAVYATEQAAVGAFDLKDRIEKEREKP